jgi:hypothetical protein
VKAFGATEGVAMDRTMVMALAAYFLSWAFVLAITLFSR